MRTDNTTNLRRAKKMTIGFVSGVNQPAHEGATVKIMKFKSDTDGNKLLKSVFSSALQEAKLQQQVQDIICNAWPLNDALREAAEDIAKDDSITDKNAALSQAVNEYILAMQIAAQGKLNYTASDFAYAPDVQNPALWKFRLTSNPGGEPDSVSVSKVLSELVKSKAEIPESDLPTVLDSVKSAWLKVFPDKSQDDLPDVLKNVEDPDMSDLEKYKALAKMSDVHKTYHDNLPEAEQEGFRSMEPSARDGVISMNQDEQFTTVSGDVVVKSKAGAMYSIMKSQNEELVKARQQTRKQDAVNRVNSEFAELPGTVDEKVQQVLALESLPEADRDLLEKQLKQSNEMWKARRNPAAKLAEDTADAKTQMNKLISDWLASNPGKKRSDAMRAVGATPEGKKLNAQMRGGE